MKFSIIVACLNAGNDLDATVNNLLSQTFTDYEVIIKDGLSNDGSIERLPRDQKITLIQRKDKNVYDAMNQAIEVAQGEYILFINAGDGLYTNDVLEKLQAYISDHSADFYYGMSHTLSNNIVVPVPPYITRFFCYRSTICHQAQVIKAALLKERGYDVQLTIFADREWLVYGFVKKGMRCVSVPIIISFFKGGGLSAYTSTTVRNAENRIIVNRYFKKRYQVVLNICLALTLPSIRKFAHYNPKISRAYFKMKRFVYRQ